MYAADTISRIADEVESIIRGTSVDAFEIYVNSSRNLNVEVKQGKVELFRFSEPAGVSVRLLRGGLGFSFSTSRLRDDLRRMVESAVVSAGAQTPDECHVLPAREEYPVIDGLFDSSLADVPREKKIDRALALEQRVLELDPRITRVHKATYAESTRTVHIRNSNGVACSASATYVSSSVSALASESGESHLGWDYDFAPSYAMIDTEAIARGVVARAVGLLGARKIPTMRCPIIFDSYVASQMLEVLSSSFIGDNVRKGKSALAGKVGTAVFSPLVSIRDDGTVVRGGATAPFDGEGTAHRNSVLVAKGIVTGFLYDSCSARKAGAESTGNAVRDGVRSIPRPGVSNLFIESGASSAAELLQGISRGMMVTEVMGMHTANPVSGDFSVGASGFLIENGAITAPVKEVAIAGNIVDVFASVESVGSDFRFFGNIGTPSLRISALDVSGS